MRVIYKPTGQVGEIPDDKFDPSLFSVVGQSSQPSMQSEPVNQPSDLSSNVGSTILNLLKEIVKPFSDTGRNIVGATVQTPLALLQSNAQQAASNSNLPTGFREGAAKGRDVLGNILGLVQKAGLSDQEFQNISTNPGGAMTDQLKRGANMASWGVPFGKGTNFLTKALLPGAGVGALQGISKENVTPESLIGDTALGAGGAGLLHGLFGMGGQAFQIGGKALTKIGEGLSVKTLRPSPSQQAKFAQETGEKLGEFLQKRNLQGAGFDQIDTHIAPIQQSFDEAGSSVIVKSSDILNKFDEQIKRLKQSVLPADKQKAQALKAIKNNFKEKYGSGDIGGDVVTSLRQDVDKGIRDFKLDETTKGPLNLVRDVLQNSIRDSADKAGVTIGDMSVKEAGVELSKLYKLLDIAEKQQYLGQGASPFGLRTLLGAGAGGAMGGLPGAVAGMAATNVANNPGVLSSGSKAASRIATGQKLPVMAVFHPAARRVTFTTGMNRTSISRKSLGITATVFLSNGRELNRKKGNSTRKK